MSKLKKGLQKSHNVVKARTGAYVQHGARHGMSAKRTSHDMPHTQVYGTKGRVESDNSTTGNRSSC